jgi:SagB-type dehydrogenase family enzyme
MKQATSSPIVLLDSHFCSNEIYVVSNNVLGLYPGIYHYQPVKHYLSIIREGDYREDLKDLSQGQSFVGRASVALFITAVFERFMFRYRQPRAYRELLISTSELAHHLILAATALGIKTFETPALKDSKVCDLLKISGLKEDVLYFLALGK